MLVLLNIRKYFYLFLENVNLTIISSNSLENWFTSRSTITCLNKKTQISVLRGNYQSSFSMNSWKVNISKYFHVRKYSILMYSRYRKRFTIDPLTADSLHHGQMAAHSAHTLVNQPLPPTAADAIRRLYALDGADGSESDGGAVKISQDGVRRAEYAVGQERVRKKCRGEPRRPATLRALASSRE